LKKHVGKSVQLVGWPIASKEVTTVKAEPMEFWAFEDESAVFHAVLFPRAYAKFCRLLVSVQPLVIAGVVQEEYGAATLNVLSMKALKFAD
jgi:DNA polymerase III alpha subunit